MTIDINNTTQKEDGFIDSKKERRNQLKNSSRIFSLAKASSIRSAQQRVTEVIDCSNPPISSNRVLRQLVRSEIETLRSNCCCRCDDWSRLFLLLPKTIYRKSQNKLLEKYVSYTTFHGIVILGIVQAPIVEFEVEDDRDNDIYNIWKNLLPIGIHSNIVVSNSIIETNSARVYHNTMICDTHIHSHAMVIKSGILSSWRSNNNGINDNQKMTITVGPESGNGIPIHVTPETTMIQVCHHMTFQHKQEKKTYDSEEKNNIIVSTDNNNSTRYNSSLNIISSQCVVRDTPTIKNGIYLSKKSCISGATMISNTILLPESTISNDCTVESTFLQWNASISNSSTVSNSFIMEHSHCGPNTQLHTSILGSDVHVSNGEIHCSILGSNTNAHHQSLLISVLWPLGRGNIGYGSNIGSNHTGRLPDQQLVCGEGIFWGLGCVIKYPLNLSHSPYSMIASGVVLSPGQIISMPFSLIAQAGEGNKNQILPGWLLSASPYTIERSEKKFATRQKSVYHSYYTKYKIIRYDTILMCYHARTQLLSLRNDSQNLKQQGGGLFGIGDNILTEKSLQMGIRTYTTCIRRYALNGFFAKLIHLFKQKQRISIKRINNKAEIQFLFANYFESTIMKKGNTKLSTETTESDIKSKSVVEWPCFPWQKKTDSSDDTEWKFQLSILHEEYPLCYNEKSKDDNNTTIKRIDKSNNIFAWLIELLQNLLIIEKEYTNSIYKSKNRDDKRGVRTIPNYHLSNVLVDNDPVILSTNKKLQQLTKKVNNIIQELEHFHDEKQQHLLRKTKSKL